MNRYQRAFVAVLLLAVGVLPALAALPTELAEQLRALDSGVVVLGTVRQPPLAGMLARDHAARLREANVADRVAWGELRDRPGWERFRDARLRALRASLGTFPEPPKDVKVRVTATHDGEGYQVDNLVFETRPGLLMTANLYRPAKPAASMPGVLIVHSHQQPKHVGWRQDMAMTWARAGCVVIVPDLVGHGERRQHPFPEPNPHDYHFRYDSAIQFSLVGDSLMGWFVWDLMRAVDVLLKHPGVDAKRVIAMSEPAGGGDVAAVTAALDTRITGAVINNFGGPQPETPYPLPRDAETSFEYAGAGSWESTRNLRNSARDGFFPWAIVASIAPRRVIYYHEFYWDREQDPVWKRLQKVWGWYDAADNLTGLAGRGFVVGSEPQNTHWHAESRELLYPQFKQWFGIPNPGKEYSNRRPVADLLCFTPEIAKEQRPAHELAARLGVERTAAAREARDRMKPEDRRKQAQRDWANLLGNVEPGRPQLNRASSPESLGDVRVERLHLATEPGIVVPTLLLIPPTPKGKVPPVVVGVSQHGKGEFLKQRSTEIAELLRAGVAVCLPDVRGTGETNTGDTRDRRSSATATAAGELMLGQSVLGGRVRDLRTLLAYLRTRSDLDARKIAMWGESFAPVNASDTDLKVPYTASKRPAQSEPLGGLLALLGGLFEDDVRAVLVRGGLSDYQSLLDSPFTYVPFDAAVSGVLTVGDLPDLAAAVAPRHLRIEGLVDGQNRRAPADRLTKTYAPTVAAYKAAGHTGRLLVDPKPVPSVAEWFAAGLRD
ncbi:MAG: acetylxylan esterase [Planctomycetes bacterium]|nr:acetylxylan esterase [Planctomycetota bacterium]